MPTLLEVTTQAMQLPREAQVKLAEQLLESAGHDEGMEPDDILAEAIRRDEAVERGEEKLLTEEEFFSWLNKRTSHLKRYQ
jgi:hypothetical protein